MLEAEINPKKEKEQIQSKEETKKAFESSKYKIIPEKPKGGKYIERNAELGPDARYAKPT